MEITEQSMIDGWVRESGGGFPYPHPDYYAILSPVGSTSNWDREAMVRMGKDRWTMMDSITEEEKAVWAEHRAAIEAEWRALNPSYRLQVTQEGALTARHNQGRSRRTVELARFNGKRDTPKGFVLLNGDGFDDRLLQMLQARLRRLVQETFRSNAQRLIVPHAALTAANLTLASIEPIHISSDRRVSIRTKVPRPPDRVLSKIAEPGLDHTAISFEHNGRRYTVRRTKYPPSGGYNQNGVIVYSIMHLPEFSNEEGWHFIQADENGDWYVTEQVHRLGSSVFWAAGADGQRHRWISSFDQNENPPMYFLAQLPDKGGIRYVTHAERLLAPKIVQKARKDGRRVFRQGDIFAVETDLTDKDFSLRQVTKRTEVFDYPAYGYRHLLPRGPEQPPMEKQTFTLETSPLALYLTTAPAPKDPLGLDMFEHSWLLDERNNMIMQAPLPPLKARRGLMIYGTGHTASVVAQTPRGTFMKGVMYHDPILENVRAARQPEHMPLLLTEGKWFLAVRNTVPRLNNNDSGGDTNASTGVPHLPHAVPGLVGGLPEPELPGRAGGRDAGRR